MPLVTNMVEMIRNLLKERFRLVVHTDPRELEVYRLVLAKSDAGWALVCADPHLPVATSPAFGFAFMWFSSPERKPS
jgi:hypothetical protein